MSDKTPPRSWSTTVLWMAMLATGLRVWLGPVSFDSPALAQVPDAGLQRQQLMAETKRTNELLSELVNLLKTQTIKVRLEDSDKSGAKLPVPNPQRQ